MRKHNFSAGPSILSKAVFEQAAEALLDFNGSGLSILEISHRSRLFMDVIEEAQSLVRELMGLTNDFEVLFLSGGATSQFYMTAMNLLVMMRQRLILIQVSGRIRLSKKLNCLGA